MPEILPLAEAVAKIDAKTPIGSLLRSREWADVPLALRERAQFSAGIESARLLQIIQDRLAAELRQQREAIANGQQATFDRSSFIDAVRGVARDEGLGGADNSVRDIQSVSRLGLIYDMQKANANGFARHKLDTSEGALALFPACRLGPSTAREPRPQIWWERRWFEAGNAVGWSGAAKNEMVALKTSPIWMQLSTFGTPWPPFDWGSTRELEEVSRDEALALGLIQEEWRPPVAAEGGEDFNAGLQASARGFSPAMASQLRRLFGSAIQFVGDTIEWAMK
jgi:hypothetical protein